jgi:hypothetical protein
MDAAYLDWGSAVVQIPALGMLLQMIAMYLIGTGQGIGNIMIQSANTQL